MSHEADKRPIIIIKKINKKHPHHGGAWKIAYADFVTAMMAFFLLMWLLSMVNKYQLSGISNYFKKPLKEVFVYNKQNDTKTPIVPDQDTKKFKEHLTVDEKVEINAQSRGRDGNDKNTGQAQNAQEVKEHNTKESEELKSKLEADLEKSPEAKQFKQQLTFEVVRDGLKVNLHDLENKAMFSLGKDDFQLYAKSIIKWLSAELSNSDRRVMIIGHADANQYTNSADYTNWELSADRANATRRALIKNGLAAEKIIRVQGAADSVLLDKSSGKNPINRRIEIILLTKNAAERMLDGK